MEDVAPSAGNLLQISSPFLPGVWKPADIRRLEKVRNQQSYSTIPITTRIKRVKATTFSLFRTSEQIRYQGKKNNSARLS
jgi:hypothetical protein